ncbi:hypothetical protein D9M73_62630 [compost metagenome]
MVRTVEVLQCRQLGVAHFRDRLGSGGLCVDRRGLLARCHQRRANVLGIFRSLAAGVVLAAACQNGLDLGVYLGRGGQCSVGLAGAFATRSSSATRSGVVFRRRTICRCRRISLGGFTDSGGFTVR